MKATRLIFASLLIASALQAQAPATGEKLPGVRVKTKRVEIEEQQTPMFNVSNVKMKQGRAGEPKSWIELDIEFEIKVPPSPDGEKGSYSGLKLNVYVALEHKNKEGKREVLMGSLDLIDVPADEPCHALAYISPAVLKSIFHKDRITSSSDISGWGVEFIAEGKVVDAKSKVGKVGWWENKELFDLMQDTVVSKVQTPFAMVFGDYDVQVKAK